MQPYLPERSQSLYNLRAKAHNKEIISKTIELGLNDIDYFVSTKKHLRFCVFLNLWTFLIAAELRFKRLMLFVLF